MFTAVLYTINVNPRARISTLFLLIANAKPSVVRIEISAYVTHLIINDLLMWPYIFKIIIIIST